MLARVYLTDGRCITIRDCTEGYIPSGNHGILSIQSKYCKYTFNMNSVVYVQTFDKEE